MSRFSSAVEAKKANLRGVTGDGAYIVQTNDRLDALGELVEQLLAAQERTNQLLEWLGSRPQG